MANWIQKAGHHIKQIEISLLLVFVTAVVKPYVVLNMSHHVS